MCACYSFLCNLRSESWASSSTPTEIRVLLRSSRPREETRGATHAAPGSYWETRRPRIALARVPSQVAARSGCCTSNDISTELEPAVRLLSPEARPTSRNFRKLAANIDFLRTGSRALESNLNWFEFDRKAM